VSARQQFADQFCRTILPVGQDDVRQLGPAFGGADDSHERDRMLRFCDKLRGAVIGL
jgi:hypothetical protein